MTKPLRSRVKGDGGAGGVRAGGQGLHGGEAAHAQGSDGRLGAAAEHHVAVAVPDVAEGVAHGVGAAGAGGDHAAAHALQAKAGWPIRPAAMLGMTMGMKKGEMRSKPLAKRLAEFPTRSRPDRRCRWRGSRRSWSASSLAISRPLSAKAFGGGDEGQLGKAVHLLGFPLVQMILHAPSLSPRRPA